jgi:hypothetical protein
VLVYCNNADASAAGSSILMSIPSPVGSLGSRDGERSKMELCAGRLDHFSWLDGFGTTVADEVDVLGVEEFCGPAGAGGTNDQEVDGVLYRSRREPDAIEDEY